MLGDPARDRIPISLHPTFFRGLFSGPPILFKSQGLLQIFAVSPFFLTLSGVHQGQANDSQCRGCNNLL